MDEKVQVKQNN